MINGKQNVHLKHYFCYHCGEMFRTTTESQNHLMRSHRLFKSKLLCLSKEFNSMVENESTADNYENVVVISGPVDESCVIKNLITVLKARLDMKKDKIHDNKPTTSYMPNSTMKTLTILQTINKITQNFVPLKARFTCGVDLCKDILQSEATLEIHLQREHKNPIQFQCAHCVYSIGYPGNNLIKEHLKVHGRVLFVCCFCDFVSTTYADMNCHLNKSHKSVRYYLVAERTECGANRRFELIHTEKTASLNKECVLCNRSLLDDELEQHVRLEHDMLHTYRCNYCSIENKISGEVEKHLEKGGHRKPFRMKEIYSILNTIVVDEIDKNVLPKTINKQIELKTENSSSNSNCRLLGKRSALTNIQQEEPEELEGRAKIRKTSVSCVFYCPKCSYMEECQIRLAEHMLKNHGAPLNDVQHTVAENANVQSPVVNQDAVGNPSNGGQNLIINIEDAIYQNDATVNVTVSYTNTEKCEQKEPLVEGSGIKGIRVKPMSELLREDLRSKGQQSDTVESVMVVDSEDEFIDIDEAITKDVAGNVKDNSTTESAAQPTQSGLCIQSVRSTQPSQQSCSMPLILQSTETSQPNLPLLPAKRPQSRQPIQSASSLQPVQPSSSMHQNITIRQIQIIQPDASSTPQTSTGSIWVQSNELLFKCFYCTEKHLSYQDILRHWHLAHKSGNLAFKFCIIKRIASLIAAQSQIMILRNVIYLNDNQIGSLPEQTAEELWLEHLHALENVLDEQDESKLGSVS